MYFCKSNGRLIINYSVNVVWVYCPIAATYNYNCPCVYAMKKIKDAAKQCANSCPGVSTLNCLLYHKFYMGHYSSMLPMNMYMYCIYMCPQPMYV